MKTARLLMILIACLLGFASFSFADSIDQRVRHAYGRIDRGIQSGLLTREEAHRLKSELRGIREDEARMLSDGRLSPHERERLHRELSRLERHISNLKRNDDTRRPDYRGYDDRRHDDRRYDGRRY